MPDSSSSPRLRLRLLGEMEIAVDGAPPVGKIYGKLLAIMAWLAVESDRSHARECLASLFWPHLSLDAARTNLRQALYHLRNTLGDECLVAGREAVRLHTEDFWTDVGAFLAVPDCSPHSDGEGCTPCLERMEDAAALWRGEFLSGLELGDAPEFEEWRATRREALHRRMFSLVERLRDCRERQGALDQALVHARRAVELEPWDETAQRALMRLLAATGRRSEALGVFETCRELLRRDLGIVPEAATCELAERIRADAASGTGEPFPPPFSERRQATVLHCVFDLPGEDDPEAVAATQADLFARCAEVARRQGGHVVGGDPGTLTAWFGYPAADEDAARRAVRAALALSAAVASGVRIGLTADTIVTSGDPDHPDAAGLALKRARRLAERAEHNTPLIGEPLALLVEGYFRLEAVPEEHGMRARRVLGETGASCRLDAAASLLPLVGREKELAMLRALWEESWQGRGHRVVLRGEAGIGKSRLLRALRESLADVPWSIREMYCLQEHRDTPLQATVVLIERLLAFGHDDTLPARRDMLWAYLSAYHAPFRDRAYPLMEALLGLGTPSSALPPERRQEAIAVLLELFGDAARRQPLLLVVEDVHWADAATLELLGLAATHGADLPVLSIYTTRPDKPLPDWLADNALVLDLAPLDAVAMKTLVEEAEAGLADETVRAIVARAEGVPLFGEELARCVTETGEVHIPPSLDALLAARLQAAGSARRLAQLAAALGREFDRELLGQVATLEADVLAAQLSVLEAARLIVPAGGDRYRFRHALIRDAAYFSLTKAERRETHRHIADILSTHFPQRLCLDPGEAARHLAAADDA